jgi:hypothetical protein
MDEADPFLSEKDVVERYPVLSPYALKKARKAGIIAFRHGRWKSAWYRASAIEDFLKRTEQPCLEPGQDLSLSSRANGSRTEPARPSYADTGLSQELAERVGRHLARQI